jgi:transposase, IS5 family
MHDFCRKPGRKIQHQVAPVRTKPIKQKQANFIFKDLLDQLNPKDPLLVLANRIPWQRFEEEFPRLYSTVGRPAKPIRLMVGLMILKQLENLSDEQIIEAWIRNPHYQAFCGERHFQWKFPCDATDLIYFRRRIGEEGAKLIFEVSVGLHGDAAMEREVLVDTTVQEKNLTFPTDVKLLTKVIHGCRKIAKGCKVQLRRSYRRELARLSPRGTGVRCLSLMPRPRPSTPPLSCPSPGRAKQGSKR